MQERLQATIPDSNKWHTEDVEAKAKELGMEKTEFILKAVDMLMGFDPVFYSRITDGASQLNIPVWLYVQNKLIKEMALEAAKVERKTWTPKLLEEFQFINEGGKNRTITGEELFNNLKRKYANEIFHSEIQLVKLTNTIDPDIDGKIKTRLKRYDPNDKEVE